MRVIYLDHAATTAALPEVVGAMQPYFREEYGNPSAMYQFSAGPRQAIRRAREQCAALIGARPEEIYFTSGGTEADNWAVRSAAEAGSGKHIVTTAIEHHAVLRPLEMLEKRGYTVTRLMPDAEGRIDPEAVARALRQDTCLISVMAANNEIGTIEPVREIGEIAQKCGILFHTDAVQAYGHIPLDVEADAIDMLSVSAHKFGGPRGTGFLYIRRGVPVGALIRGGSQESGRRAGTENTPAIVGMGLAAEMAGERLAENAAREKKLRDRLADHILSAVPDARLNGPAISGKPGSAARLSNNLNLRFPGVRAEELLIRLDMQGICASAGSACETGATEPSHVLSAIGLSREEARESIRFTVGPENTEEEIDRAADLIAADVRKIRGTSL